MKTFPSNLNLHLVKMSVFQFLTDKNPSWIKALSYLTKFCGWEWSCRLFPVVLCFCLIYSIKVFVCKQDSPTYPEMQRQSGDGQRWKCRVKCVWAGDQSRRSAECQSCCWSWPPHMALCPGYASRCVTSESAVCVCVRLTQTHTHTLCEKRDLCNNPPPSYGYICITPLFPSSCFHFLFHHCDGHDEASVTTIWYDKMWHYTHVTSLGMERHRLLNRGKKGPKMVEWSGLFWECWTGQPVERQLRLGVTEWERKRHSGEQKREWVEKDGDA